MESKEPELSLAQVPLFEELKKGTNILISGAGGGYDVYCGLPLYFALRAMGKNVFLGSLTFCEFTSVKNSELLQDDVREITSKSRPKYSDDTYFPEGYLAQWFEEELKEEVPVYMISRNACIPVFKAYQALVKQLNIDTIVLVDGGTDSLMRGDEEQLGSPHEDMCSIAAVDMLKDVPRKFLAAIGFGVDAFHGVSHALFLENVSNLIKTGGFLGTFSLIKEMKEARLYQKACEYAFKRMQKSIVSGSISAAIDGHYGNHQFTNRTTGSELWINPLMSMYWCFKLDPLAKSIYCLEEVKKTKNYWDLSGAIYGGRAKAVEDCDEDEVLDMKNKLQIRPSRNMPV